MGTIYVLKNIINGKMYVGQTIHDAHRRIMGHKGHPWSDDMKKLLSQKCSGYHHTKEARAKMSAANKGVPSHKAKPVFCVETGQIFHCANSAAEWFGVHSVGIGKVCRGQLKTSGGKRWAYMEVA